MSTISIYVSPSITTLRIFSHLRIEEYIYSILSIIMILIPKYYFEVHHDVIDNVHEFMLVLYYP